MSLRSRTRLAAVVAALLLLPAGVQARAADATAAAQLPAKLVQLRNEVAALRAGLAHTGFAAPVRSVLALRHAAHPSVAALPAPGAAEVAAVQGLSSGLRAPVAGLAAAARAAHALLGDLPAADVRAAARALEHDLASYQRRARAARPAATRTVRGGDGMTTTTTKAAAVPVAVTPLPATVRAAHEQAPQAATVLAVALDAYLPALRAARVTRQAGSAAAACDLLNQLPALCVSSDADNTYTVDAVLTVDLGGDDVYRTTAGGAPFLPVGGAAWVPVSVNVDLDGDDTYVAPEADVERTGLRPVTAQGGGSFGGVGILVDEAGDDTYTAEVNDPTFGIYAHGSSAGGGFGALFDLAGDDTYSAKHLTAGPDPTAVVAQGSVWGCGAGAHVLEPVPLVSAGCSVGMLVDSGAGDDRYDAHSAVLDGTTVEPWPIKLVFAQAAANLGVAVLSDDGGADHFAVSAAARDLGRQAYGGEGAAMAWVLAQGFGGAGRGHLLEGTGPTTYDVSVDSEGFAWNRVWVQASATLAGAGALDDLGGNDAYRADVTMDLRQEITVDGTCRRLGQPCDRASATVRAGNCVESAVGSSCQVTQELAAQGVNVSNAFALLDDHAGDDRYAAASRESVDIRLRDELPAPKATASLDVAGYLTASLSAQGVGVDMLPVPGHGFVIDQGGTDVYEAVSDNVTAASAASETAGLVPAVTAVTEPKLFVEGQGASSGGSTNGLIDLGGTGDRFLASARNPARTSPDGGRSLAMGYDWPLFHGAGTGGVFHAGGANPTVVSAPSAPVCGSGSRGFGAWRGCPYAGAASAAAAPGQEWFDSQANAHVYSSNTPAGWAPFASGTFADLQVLPGSPAGARDGGTVPVAARLHAPSGAPMPDTALVFSLQAQPCNLPGAWLNMWETEAVTDAEGVARAALPSATQTPRPPSHYSQPCAEAYRIHVTFNGAAGLYPARVSQPVTITP